MRIAVYGLVMKYGERPCSCALHLTQNLRTNEGRWKGHHRLLLLVAMDLPEEEENIVAFLTVQMDLRRVKGSQRKFHFLNLQMTRTKAVADCHKSDKKTNILITGRSRMLLLFVRNISFYSNRTVLKSKETIPSVFCCWPTNVRRSLCKEPRKPPTERSLQHCFHSDETVSENVEVITTKDPENVEGAGSDPTVYLSCQEWKLKCDSLEDLSRKLKVENENLSRK